MLLVARRKPLVGQKKVCIVRYGAWGDAIMTSPVFKAYKEDHWYTILNCTTKCWEILRTDPNIDAFIVQNDGEIPFEKLEAHWTKLKAQVDKFINLSGSIENQLLISPSQPEYSWSNEKLHKRCDKNYYDHTMQLAGYPKKKGEVGNIFFTKNEENFAKKMRKKYKGFFVVWCLTGSSIHKIYPHADAAIQALVKGAAETYVILVGEGGAKGIINPHRRIIDKCGEFGIRESFVLAKHADLVVSTETSVLAAAGCFDTPKVALLSHGSEENVTKYYKNCYTIREKVSCAPCHRLHYTRDTCPLNPEFNHPICMALLSPKKVLEPIEKIYLEWRKKNGCSYSTH